jgi:hypothetical protein
MKNNHRYILIALYTLFMFSSLFTCTLAAQDTLPNFSVINPGNNRYIISWTNTFETIKQISIQRSFDSAKNYTTIMTVPDPTTPQNGYVDAKAPNPKMFYRIYILLDKGVYLFSKAKRPVLDTVITKKIFSKTDRTVVVPDSITIKGIPELKPEKKVVEIYKPSVYVFTQGDGNVRIKLPEDMAEKKYSLKFFEMNETFLFEIKEINQSPVILDKVNFYHTGWFISELYADGKLMEKHKFYIRKEM